MTDQHKKEEKHKFDGDLRSCLRHLPSNVFLFLVIGEEEKEEWDRVRSDDGVDRWISPSGCVLRHDPADLQHAIIKHTIRNRKSLTKERKWKGKINKCLKILIKECICFSFSFRFLLKEEVWWPHSPYGSFFKNGHKPSSVQRLCG